MKRKLAAVLLLIPLPALADTTQGGKTIDCYCTDKTGSRIELGQTICMEVGGRLFMAQCQMSLNVPMWREMQEGCLSSDARPFSPRPAIPVSLSDAPAHQG
jgi:hypothetical protein